MWEKTERCVVTFPTTASAMAMEAAAQQENVPGRLIPIPRSISAGCGMCWSAPKEAQPAVEDLVIQKGLQIDGIYAILL